MQDHWYYKTDRAAEGPVTLRELRRMAADGRLMPWDEVCRGGTTRQWQPFGDVAFDTGTDAATSDSKQPLQNVSDRESSTSVPDPPSTDAPAAHDNRRVSTGVIVTGETSEFVTTPPRGTNPRRPRRPVDTRPANRVGTWIEKLSVNQQVVVALAMVAAVNVLLLVLLNGQPDPDRQRYATYMSIWNELKQLRSEEASKDEWSEFASRGSERLEPIIVELEESASVERPIQQHLLWSGRDCLMLMLTDARRKPSPSEEEFAKHMRHLQRLFGERYGPRAAVSAGL